MRGKLFSCLAALLLIFLVSGRAEAANVEMSGKTVSTSGQISGGTTYVPLRELFSAFGEWEISWDNSIRTAKAEGELFTLSFPVGSSTALVDGYAIEVGRIFLRNNTTYVPLRAVANLLGADTIWNGNSRPIQLVERATYRSHSDEDLYWLSRIISAESQGESLLGQLAVGHVIINRVESRQFPNTIKDVIFDVKYAVQFEPVSNGSIYWEPTARSVLAAKMVLNGTEAVGESMYFYAPALSQGTWINQNRTYYTTIGCHKFYL